MAAKNKNLTLQEAVTKWKHEKQRIKRAGEETWCEIHEEKLIRVDAGSSIRGIKIEDAIATDWEAHPTHRILTGDDLRESMICQIRSVTGRNVSPMALLEMMIEDLGL